jgi:2-polyprenyl-3-methyl-5-hydroxy-6-metoxy-1,4-benzoquinol methylase
MQDEQHWSELSPNPISVEAMNHVRAVLRSKHIGALENIRAIWDGRIRGKSVLDIGVVEHSLDFVNRPGWKHRLLRDLAARIVGVDILADAAAELNRQGYDVRVCDATSDADLGERFDVVYIGDVIEHVKDPTRLLQFAGRHLKPDGEIIVTTPSPYWWRNILSMVSNDTYIGNVDHVCWIGPVHALELAHRSSLRLDSYYTIETDGNTGLKQFAHGLIDRILGKHELFTWAYAYILKHKA